MARHRSYIGGSLTQRLDRTPTRGSLIAGRHLQTSVALRRTGANQLFLDELEAVDIGAATGELGGGEA